MKRTINNEKILNEEVLGKVSGGSYLGEHQNLMIGDIVEVYDNWFHVTTTRCRVIAKRQVYMHLVEKDSWEYRYVCESLADPRKHFDVTDTDIEDPAVSRFDEARRRYERSMNR